MGGACSTCGGEERNSWGVWLGNLKETHHLERPRHRLCVCVWGGANKMDIQEIEW